MCHTDVYYSCKCKRYVGQSLCSGDTRAPPVVVVEELELYVIVIPAMSHLMPRGGHAAGGELCSKCAMRTLSGVSRKDVGEPASLFSSRFLLASCVASRLVSGVWCLLRGY